MPLHRAALKVSRKSYAENEQAATGLAQGGLLTIPGLRKMLGSMTLWTCNKEHHQDDTKSNLCLQWVSGAFADHEDSDLGDKSTQSESAAECLL